MPRYIIINAEAIQKRIEELGEITLKTSNEDNRGFTQEVWNDLIDDSTLSSEYKILKQIISQSTPLIPSIKDIQIWLSKQSYQKEYGEQEYMMYYDVDIPKIIQDCISNLKLDI